MSIVSNPSLPKDKIRVLLLEGISDTAVAALAKAGYHNVEHLPGALDERTLIEKLTDVRILGIRSRTQVTAKVLEATSRLMAVGCFSVGTNQIDLDAAQHRGVPVFNAPFSNTRSVAELTIAEIVMLYRRTFHRSVKAHAGAWEKSASQSHEIRGKTLGIVGYGNIGTQLAALAEAMGMRVIYFDQTDKLRYGNVEPAASLEELLATADVVTLHVPETDATRNMIGSAEIAKLKDGALLINNARGTLIDLDGVGPERSSRKSSPAPRLTYSRSSHPATRKPSVLRYRAWTMSSSRRMSAARRSKRKSGLVRKLPENSRNTQTLVAQSALSTFREVLLPSRPAGTRFLQVQRNEPGALGQPERGVFRPQHQHFWPALSDTG